MLYKFETCALIVALCVIALGYGKTYTQQCTLLNEGKKCVYLNGRNESATGTCRIRSCTVKGRPPMPCAVCSPI